MKNLTTLTLTIAMFFITLTHAFAQKNLKFDENCKAEVSKTLKPASKDTYTVSGKEFKQLVMSQTKGKSIKYEVRIGNEFLSSGHTTGSNITINSDGKSTYKIILMNGEREANPIVLSITKSGGGSCI